MTIIKVGGDAESSTGQFVLPIMTQAKGIYFTNADSTKLKCNFAINQLSASIIGQLSPSATSTVMGNHGHVQTDITETDNMTIFAIYKHPASLTSSGAMIVSTHQGDRTSFGCGLFASRSDVNFIATQYLDGTKLTAGGRPTPANGWTLAAGRVDGSNNTIKNLTTNTQSTQSYNGRKLGNSPQVFKIGGSYENKYADDIEIMCVVIFDVALSDNDIATVANVLRQYAQKHGVSV